MKCNVENSLQYTKSLKCTYAVPLTLNDDNIIRTFPIIEQIVS